jgi:hypothetical protein
MAIAIDLTIPDTGVIVTSNTTGDAFTFGNQRDVDDLLQNLLVRAMARAVVENNTPYALDVDIAYVAGDLGDQDVFLAPGAVILDRVTVEAPSLTADGRVAEPQVDTAEVIIAADDLDQLIVADPAEGMPTPRFTATVKVRLRAGTGAGGRAALGADARAILKSAVVVEVTRGGAQ